MSDLLKKANDLRLKFKTDEAINVYIDYLNENPKDTVACANLGLCYFSKSDYKNAHEMFLKSFDLSNMNDDLVAVYKTVMEIILDLPYSFEFVKDKSIIIDNYMDILENVIEHKDIETGFKLFEKFISEINNENWFNDPDNQYRVILVISNLGDIETAETMAQTLMKRTEFSWQGLGSYANVLMKKGLKEDAKETFKKALSKGGDSDKRFLGDVMKASYDMI